MPFETDDLKYIALENRDPSAEGHFVYCVKSTMICCRPTCYSRLALRRNIAFCKDVKEAMDKNYRPCKRCKPNIETGWNSSREMVIRACSLICRIASNGKKFVLDTLVEELKVSKFHFCRMFKNYTGLTPRQFYLKCKELKENPLKSKPLPIVETKKNLKRKKLLARNTITTECSSRNTLENSEACLSSSDTSSMDASLSSPGSNTEVTNDNESALEDLILQHQYFQEEANKDLEDLNWVDDFIEFLFFA
ncbi:uncharacterized protein RJT20DRAFT_127477 [Scheffersomyces xylosifermentans]|uniref:uncharacterized protein n=1 Tax=Scheffersomyces xylosifermentans TaxID=1304137 RepID=UPI00315C7E22